MKTKKIVLTGGPCAGKTTALTELEKEFTEKGYQVLMVPEAATILINNGIRPFGPYKLKTVDFQRQVIKLQLTLEDLALETAKKTNCPSIILCDRGILDDKAYVTKEEWQQLLKEFDTTDLNIMNRYDSIIHLRTAALGKEEFYTLDNNSARTETVDEARQKDKDTLASWLGHEKLKIIGNESTFEDKIKAVVKEVYHTLSKPYPIQIQRKFIIDDIALDDLEDNKLVKLDIEQYVINSGTIEYTFRKTTKDNETTYTLLTKIDTDIDNERVRTSRKITEEEYYQNLSEEEKPIRKTRYCFEYQNNYFRLDIFEQGLILLEIEPTTKEEKIALPSFLTIKEEVTNNKDYRNSSLYERLNFKQKGSAKVRSL